MHKWACYHNEAANHQLPVAAAFWIIKIVSVEECSSLRQNLMQIHCSTHSVILKPHSTHAHSTASSALRLVQWSHHCSHMHIPVHFPWLPVYINNVQTILIILTMIGIFLDRSCIYKAWYPTVFTVKFY